MKATSAFKTTLMFSLHLVRFIVSPAITADYCHLHNILPRRSLSRDILLFYVWIIPTFQHSTDSTLGSCKMLFLSSFWEGKKSGEGDAFHTIELRRIIVHRRWRKKREKVFLFIIELGVWFSCSLNGSDVFSGVEWTPSRAGDDDDCERRLSEDKLSLISLKV